MNIGFVLTASKLSSIFFCEHNFSIRHEFDFVGRNHHMEMYIVNDTIPVLHDAIESSIEPRPKRKGLGVTTLYEIEDV